MSVDAPPIPRLTFPSKLSFLLEPHRFKVAYGGRGGLKTWNFARALLIAGAENVERILCCREIQNSIKESVKQTLVDQIELTGYGDFYDVLETEIRGKNGTRIFFEGLQHHTVHTLKSYENVTKCWVEEAQTVRKKSWSILIPTIRASGSEIWVSFNPELESDETYQRFVVHPPEDAIVCRITYKDNPWVTKELEQARLRDKAQETDEDYRNIWDGDCRATVVGAIYAKEMMDAMRDGRICHVPYDPRLKVHTVWDLGHADFTAIGLFQKGYSEFRCIGYIEDRLQKLDYYAAELQKLNFNWGWDWLPHDGHTEDVKSPSAYRILTSFGRRVKPKVGSKLPIPNIEREKGIKALRMVFHRIVFDKVQTEELQTALKHYKRGINLKTEEPGEPVHDAASHGADMMRYFALICDQMTNDEERDLIPKGRPWRPFDRGTGAL